jgi:hypothetical protein
LAAIEAKNNPVESAKMPEVGAKPRQKGEFTANFKIF